MDEFITQKDLDGIALRTEIAKISYIPIYNAFIKHFKLDDKSRSDELDIKICECTDFFSSCLAKYVEVAAKAAFAYTFLFPEVSKTTMALTDGILKELMNRNDTLREMVNTFHQYFDASQELIKEIDIIDKTETDYEHIRKLRSRLEKLKDEIKQQYSYVFKL